MYQSSPFVVDAPSPFVQAITQARDLMVVDSDYVEENVDLDERDRLELDPVTWLVKLFAGYLTNPSTKELIPMAAHHLQIWAWVWAIQPGMPRHPMVAILPRGGAKSTTAELACVATGAKETRKYVLYVSETQEQADQHVQNVAGMLESGPIQSWYPRLSQRSLNRYGSSRGWRRNRLMTASGFTIDAMGLDTAARGIKVDEARPDLIILDDIDEDSDSPKITKKKVEMITRKLLPAGGPAAAVLAIQNLVSETGFFGKMVSGDADYLQNRQMLGPIPALLEPAFEVQDGKHILTYGIPTWAGQDLERCQWQVGEWGKSAFQKEALHEVGRKEGGIFEDIIYLHEYPENVPDLVRIVTACDPAVTDTDQSDAQGIHIEGIDTNGILYSVWAHEKRGSVLDTVVLAIEKSIEYHSSKVLIETDQGGDTWRSVWREAVAVVIKKYTDAGEEPPRMPAFDSDKAGSGYGSKLERMQQLIPDYELGRIRHVYNGHQKLLEDALDRYGLEKPYDLGDARWWTWAELRGKRKGDKVIPVGTQTGKARTGWLAGGTKGRK